MDGWTVTVTIAGRLDVEGAEDLEVTLHSHGPAIALGDDEWSITLAIDADEASDPLAAGHHAIRLIEAARGSVEVVGLEVMTWTEHDRQLEGAKPEGRLAKLRSHPDFVKGDPSDLDEVTWTDACPQP